MLLFKSHFFCVYSAGSYCVFFFFFNDTATTEIYTLSLHERSSDLAVADFLLGAQPHWTASWKFGVVAWTIAVLAAVVLPFGSFWPAAIAGIVGACFMVPAFGGQWPAFELRPTAGQFTTLVALHPVGFGEAARAILKANAVRIAAALP